MIYIAEKDIMELLQHIRKEEVHTPAEDALIRMIAKEIQFLNKIKIEEKDNEKNC